jgi:hypothetical protein
MAEGNDSMAIIRMAAPAGAALIILTTFVPAMAPAQAQQAPLQLVPGPGQARKATSAGTTKPTKAARTSDAKTPNTKTTNANTSNTRATRTAASRNNARQAAAAQPSTTQARTNSKKTANAGGSRRQDQVPTNAQRARVANSPRPTRSIASIPGPMLAADPAPRIFAQDDQAAADHVMRGGDSIALIARLPWWRNDRLVDVRYGSAEAANAVMAAADVWFAANGGAAVADRAPGETLALASPEEAIEVADAGQVNDIDLAAESVPAPPSPSFFQSLMALLGGVVVAAAASARLLFV